MLVLAFDIQMCIPALNAMAGIKSEFVIPAEGHVGKNNKQDLDHREDSKRSRRCLWFFSVQESTVCRARRINHSIEPDS